MKTIKRMALALLLCCGLCVPASASSYPIDIRFPAVDGGALYKIYEVTSEAEMAALPQGGFVWEGVPYTLQDTTVERTDGTIRCTLIFTPGQAETPTTVETPPAPTEKTKSGIPPILWIAPLLALTLGGTVFALVKRLSGKRAEEPDDEEPAPYTEAPGEPPREAAVDEAPREPREEPQPEPTPEPAKTEADEDLFEYPDFS